MVHVVVIVPGVMGSVLELAGETIWPGPIQSLYLPYRKMKELLDPDLVATDCIRSFVLPQYQALIDDLEDCGFDEDSGTLVVFAYDWRRSIEGSARALAARLSAIVEAQGADVEISVVAHSMGGLVSRYALESGDFAKAPGWKNVTRLLMLATPQNGATVALPLVLGYQKRLFLSADQVLQLASDPRYPGAYQLLPRRGAPVAWDGSGAPRLPLLDIYEKTIADRLGLRQGNLAAALAFRDKLEAGSKPEHVRYFCFAGNRESTAVYARLVPRTGNRLEPRAIEQEDGGDGTVPMWSSSLSHAQFLYVKGEHSTIYKTRALRVALAELLGKPGVLALGVAIEIVLREPVVPPRGTVHATLHLGAQTTQLRGRIVVERLALDAAGVASVLGTVASHDLTYDGPVVEFQSVSFEAPDIRGFYRVAYYDERAPSPSAFSELIVQEVVA